MVIHKEWLTVEEAAEQLGYSPQIVVDLIDKNRLKATTLGADKSIKFSDLLDYINQEDKERDQAMSDLIRHTEEIGGYDLK